MTGERELSAEETHLRLYLGGGYHISSFHFSREVEEHPAQHLISETARHAGHADIVREAIDGATAFPLLAAAENWPATPWLQPWQPPEA